VLSHLTAAELHGLLDTPAELIFVTVPSTRRISAPGLVVRTSERISGATQPGRQPPRTSVEETVLDLAQLAWTFDDACGWLTQACGRRLTTAAKLEQAQQLRKKIRWRHELEDVLKAAADGIHSALEYRYLRDVERAHGLPRSGHQVRVVIEGKTVYRDAYYEKFKLATELDGKLAHPDQERWRDHHRDNQAGAHGILTTRYGWRDVTATPVRPPCSRPGSCGSAAGPASPGRARQPVPWVRQGPRDRFAEFTPIASTTTGGPASHLMRLGESGTPSLVFCPETPEAPGATSSTDGRHRRAHRRLPGPGRPGQLRDHRR
jgi:hypothetical protein